MSLTNLSIVRERGALKGTALAGALTDAQITAAITLAGHTMIVEACGFVLYQSVLSLTEPQLADLTPDPITGRTNAQKQADFIDAESYFALMHCEKIVQTGKLTETGAPMTHQIGREVKTFAPMQEGVDTAAMWKDMAYTCLKPYLTLMPLDSQQNPTHVSNKKSTMLMSIF